MKAIEEKKSETWQSYYIRQEGKCAIMWKKIACFFLVGFILLSNVRVYGQEYKKIEIKHGTHEKVINEKYDQPILTEKLKPGFLFIPSKKSLYKVDESTYMILKFLAGRINAITILEDITLEEASSMFKSNK